MNNTFALQSLARLNFKSNEHFEQRFFVGAFCVVMLRCIWLAARVNPAGDAEAQRFCSV